MQSDHRARQTTDTVAMQDNIRNSRNLDGYTPTTRWAIS